MKFHHGREVTADDVVYSLTRILDRRTRSGAAELFLNLKGAGEFRDGRAKTVSGLVALGRHTVQMTLAQAYAPFVSVVAVGHAKILPRDLVEARGRHSASSRSAPARSSSGAGSAGRRSYSSPTRAISTVRRSSRA